MSSPFSNWDIGGCNCWEICGCVAPITLHGTDTVLGAFTLTLTNSTFWTVSFNYAFPGNVHCSAASVPILLTLGPGCGATYSWFYGNAPYFCPSGSGGNIGHTTSTSSSVNCNPLLLVFTFPNSPAGTSSTMTITP